MKQSIHFLTIATSVYCRFIPQLVESIKNIYSDFDLNIQISIFSDQEIKLQDIKNCKVNYSFLEHKPWPYPTLERYKTFLPLENKVKPEDFIVYTDVDMLVSSRIPFSDSTKLFGVLHPGYFQSRRKPFITDKARSVFIEKNKRVNYLCGGIQGGKAKDFFDACKVLSSMIEIDKRQNYIPKWHDESYWNHYYANNSSDFTVLGPEYCWPEEWVTDLYPGKVIALTKSSAISGTKSFLTGIKAMLGKVKRSIKKQGY